ncbi:MAG: hypothetical protein K2M60_07455 [Lachnospiraceae bacterium]|nr:hypothetical protein [Lachnospiraceae bacterium]MDE6251544.1 hypothetical protein [Lachnospiraceae bacterium]
MLQEVNDNIPSELKILKSIKKISADTTNKEFMLQSDLKVIDFDKFSKKYAHKFKIPILPKTVDGLYISKNDEWTFIEFKNGSIKTVDIYRKIYDSLIMLVEMGYLTWENCRNNAQYIVVYNENEYGEKYLECRKEQNNLKIQSHIRSLAKQPRKLFDLKNLNGYLVNKTSTLTQIEFQAQFIDLKEKEEMRYLE